MKKGKDSGTSLEKTTEKHFWSFIHFGAICAKATALKHQ